MPRELTEFEQQVAALLWPIVIANTRVRLCVTNPDVVLDKYNLEFGPEIPMQVAAAIEAAGVNYGEWRSASLAALRGKT